jgi:hypothetical protein
MVDYTSSAIPLGTIAVLIKAPTAYDLLVNINAVCVIPSPATTALGIRGTWVAAGDTYRYSIKPADIGHVLHFMFEVGDAQNVDIVFIAQ